MTRTRCKKRVSCIATRSLLTTQRETRANTVSKFTIKSAATIWYEYNLVLSGSKHYLKSFKDNTMHWIPFQGSKTYRINCKEIYYPESVTDNTLPVARISEYILTKKTNIWGISLINSPPRSRHTNYLLKNDIPVPECTDYFNKKF